MLAEVLDRIFGTLPHTFNIDIPLQVLDAIQTLVGVCVSRLHDARIVFRCSLDKMERDRVSR